VNLRHGIAAAALLATTAFTVACAAPTAGTASAGGAVASVATTSSSAAASSSAAPSSTTASPSSSSAATTQIQDAPVVIAPPTVVNQAPGLDATTAIWLQNSCTDVETLLGALLTYPAVDETTPVDDFRIAYRDYYATVSDTVLGITERMSVLDAPTIDGGQDLHDGYLAYLVGLADITAGAAIAIDAAPDAETVAAIIEQVDFEIEQLGQSDYGLADFQGDELQALMSQVPACQTLVNS
jgi:hypothetical protein